MTPEQGERFSDEYKAKADAIEAEFPLAFFAQVELVLQIGVDRHAGIPQPGAYYVIMRKQDIAARRFDRARVTYQCD